MVFVIAVQPRSLECQIVLDETASTAKEVSSSSVNDHSSAASGITETPSTMFANLYKGMNPRERKQSVAPWSDDRLTKFAENVAASNAQKESRLAHQHKSHNSLLKSTDSLKDLKFDQNDGIFQLGASLIARIFEMLDIKLQFKIREVNKGFKNVLQSTYGHLFENINLTKWNKKINDKTIGDILSVANSRTKVLILKNCWHITNTGLAHIAKHALELDHLDLHSVWDITDDGLFKIARYCDFLQSLDLSNCRKITSKGVIEVLNNAPSLKLISLSYCKSTGDDMMGHAQWMTLKSINFQRCTGIYDSGFTKWESIETPFGNPNSMTSDESAMYPLSHSLTPYFALEELNLADCSFLSNATIGILASRCTKLTRLSLSFCCSLTEEFAHILVSGCSFIENLDVSYCGNAITDLTLLILAKGLNNLHSVSIRGCVQVTDEGMGHLAEHAKCLKNINYSQCNSVTKEYILSLDAGWNLVGQNFFEFEKLEK